MNNNTIRLAGYIEESIVDGPGIRFTIFTQGCTHNCEGCHNPKTHPLDKGKILNIEDVIDLIKSNPLATGLTISGGEPFLQVESILELVKKYKTLFPNNNIIIYTGFTYEELLNFKNKIDIIEIFNTIDYLIDGLYIEKLRDLTLHFRGSSNQRIIDTKRSIQQSNIITVEL